MEVPLLRKTQVLCFVALPHSVERNVVKMGRMWARKDFLFKIVISPFSETYFLFDKMRKD